MNAPETAGANPVVEITDIAAGGEGVGRLPDGRAVFVHRTAPGESVEVRVRRQKRRWARAEAVRILESAPERRVAPCPYYDRCGGCTLEHIEYAAQLQAKRGIVTAALGRIGDVDLDVPPVVASPEEFRYRNRVSFTLRRLAGGRVVAGFHELARPGRIVDMDGACLLPEAELASVWSRLREEWGPGAERLPGGRRLRLTLRATRDGTASLLIEGGDDGGRLEELLGRVPRLAAVWQRAELASPPRLRAGEEVLVEEWGGESLALAGSAFLQVNRAVAGELESYVLERIGAVDGARVIDAYCGIGTYARALARRGACVTGIELDPAAVRAASRDAPASAEFVEARVEDALADLLPAEVVIVNPPRAGLDADVAAALSAQPPDRLIYVSCDPATLARDTRRLGPELRPTIVRCFDMFPQTAHVETVLEFECATS